MDLTAKELKLIERTRKQMRRWPMTRWIGVILVLLGLGDAALHFWLAGILRTKYNEGLLGYADFLTGHWSTNSISNLAHTKDLVSLTRSNFESQAWISWIDAMGGGLIVLTLCFAAFFLWNWRGHPDKLLLLKFSDAASQEPVSGTRQPLKAESSAPPALTPPPPPASRS